MTSHKFFVAIVERRWGGGGLGGARAVGGKLGQRKWELDQSFKHCCGSICKKNHQDTFDSLVSYYECS